MSAYDKANVNLVKINDYDFKRENAMKKIFVFIFISMIASLVAGCGSSNNNEFVQKNENGQTVSETQEGDFIYRLVTEKEAYRVGEPVKIYAELEYIGNQEEVTIYHAESPFHFPITEKTRNIQLDYAMNHPLLSTTIKKGEPLREDYIQGAGTSYSENDDEEYVTFVNEILENGFPVGVYEVNGYAYFTATNEDGVEENYTIKGQIEFEVHENE